MRMLGYTLRALIGAIGLSAVVTASAEPYRRPPDAYVMPPTPQGVGCYFYREREYCGRYCYWEVNGKRYCRERAREAHSQVPLVPYVVVPDGSWRAPMKLGAGATAR